MSKCKLLCGLAGEALLAPSFIGWVLSIWNTSLQLIETDHPFNNVWGVDLATVHSCAGPAPWTSPPSPDGSVSHEDG